MSSGTAGGNTTISVRVTYEHSHRPAAGMRVELISTSGGMADVRTTDGNGGATFDGISGGRFKLRVTGPNIEKMETDSFVAGGGE
ncbi:MAG TPA: carboxypeptidase-like regulatory domain-containing protein, partial [Candidatus Sulfotelmatobacter sp.]|nr:carboxypeptidase-like regulatory domain-containing protein [Candidatus Sulfotelmatobacter sp.]